MLYRNGEIKKISYIPYIYLSIEPKSYGTDRVFPVQNILLEQNLEASGRNPAYHVAQHGTHEVTFVPEQILQQLNSH